jgi:hypothetical protein
MVISTLQSAFLVYGVIVGDATVDLAKTKYFQWNQPICYDMTPIVHQI